MALRLSGAMYKSELQFSEEFRKYRKKPPPKNGIYKCEFPAPHQIFSKILKSINGITLTEFHLQRQNKQKIKFKESYSSSESERELHPQSEGEEYQIQQQQENSEVKQDQKKRKSAQNEKQIEKESKKKEDSQKIVKKSKIVSKTSEKRIVQVRQQQKQEKCNRSKSQEELRSESSQQTVASTPERSEKSKKLPNNSQDSQNSDFNPNKSMSRFPFARKLDQKVQKVKSHECSKTNLNEKSKQIQKQELPILVPQVIKEKLVNQVQQTRNQKSELIMKVFEMSTPIRQFKQKREQNKVKQTTSNTNKLSSIKKKVTQIKKTQPIPKQEIKCTKYKDDNDLVESLFKLDWDSYNQQNLDFRTPPVTSTKKTFNTNSSNIEGHKQLALKKVVHHVKGMDIFINQTNSIKLIIGAKLFPTHQQAELALNAQPLIILSPSLNIWGEKKQSKKQTEAPSHENILKQIIQKKIIQTTKQGGQVKDDSKSKKSR